jgi:parallel beta-helix repeat protein
MRKEIIIADMLIFFFLIFLPYAKANISVTDCTVINASDTYDLQNDISGVECIQIQQNTYNVIFDCHNYMINATNDGFDISITNTSNIAIKNCYLTGLNTGDYPRGINLAGSNVNITNNTFTGLRYGIRQAGYGSPALIDGNYFSNNQNSIYIVDVNSNNISNNQFNNDGNSITLQMSNYNDVYNNKIRDDGSCSISFEGSGSSLVYNNLLNNSCNAQSIAFGILPAGVQNWNTTIQSGTRIYGNINLIAGNYWTNATGNSFSDTCFSDTYGFCRNYSINGNNMDYMPLGYPNAFTSYLKSTCQMNFVDYAPAYMNQTFSCQTNPIDTSNCLTIPKVFGKYFAVFYNTTAKCTEASGLLGNFTGSYAFNQTNTVFYEQDYCTPFLLVWDIWTTPLTHVHSDNNTDAYLSPTGSAYSTCRYYYNNSNLTVSTIDCELDIDCGMNISALNKDCSVLCQNGVLYHNGIWDNNINTCVNFSSSEVCSIGCASLTSCTTPTIILPNQTANIQNLNITSTSAGKVIALFNSPLGYTIIFFFIIEIFIFLLTNEFLAVTTFSIFCFITGLTGLMPSGIGYLLAFFGFEILITRHEHFRD